MTYVTAGYPTAEETVDVMLGMEAGGAGKKECQIEVEGSNTDGWRKMLSNSVFLSQTQLPMVQLFKKPTLFVYFEIDREYS